MFQNFSRVFVRASSFLLTVMCTLILAGCASLEGYPKSPEGDAVLNALQSDYFSPSAEAAYDSISPADANYATLRRSLRDDIVLSKIHVYDIEFSQFERALNANSNYLAVGSDLTALTLNGLAATTGTAGTKAALSAASGGVIGAQGDINKDVYYQKTIPAVIAQMEANRAKVKLAIFTGLKQSDADYPLKRADSDLDDLNDAGSLPNAINNITQTSTQQKNTTQSAIQSFQSLTYATSSTAQKLRAWLYTGRKVNISRYNALQQWLDNNSDASLHGLPAAALATGDTTNSGLEAVRQRALGDPTLNIPK